jgi:hypothetical protein
MISRDFLQLAPLIWLPPSVMLFSSVSSFPQPPVHPYPTVYVGSASCVIIGQNVMSTWEFFCHQRTFFFKKKKLNWLLPWLWAVYKVLIYFPAMPVVHAGRAHAADPWTCCFIRRLPVSRVSHHLKKNLTTLITSKWDSAFIYIYIYCMIIIHKCRKKKKPHN